MYDVFIKNWVFRHIIKKTWGLVNKSCVFITYTPLFLVPSGNKIHINY